MTKTKKIGLAVASIGVAAVIAAGLTIGIGLQRSESDVTDYGKQMRVTADEGNGIKLMSAEQTIDNVTTQTITATVTPENALNAVLDWSVEWLDAYDADAEAGGWSWGSGTEGTQLYYWNLGHKAKGEVTDYVDVTPTADGALSAVVSCYAPFGTPIVITASVRGDSTVYGSCSVDYVQKYEGVSMGISTNAQTGFAWEFGESDEYALSFPTASSEEEFRNLFTDGALSAATITVNYSSVYTIPNSADSVSLSFANTSEYETVLRTTFPDYADEVSIGTSDRVTMGVSKSSESANTFVFTDDEKNTAFGYMFAADQVEGLFYKDVWLNDFKIALLNNSDAILGKITIEVTSTETTGTETVIYNWKFNATTIGNLVQQVELPDIRF